MWVGIGGAVVADGVAVAMLMGSTEEESALDPSLPSVPSMPANPKTVKIFFRF
jgi:hypothetical protein